MASLISLKMPERSEAKSAKLSEVRNELTHIRSIRTVFRVVAESKLLHRNYRRRALQKKSFHLDHSAYLRCPQTAADFDSLQFSGASDPRENSRNRKRELELNHWPRQPVYTKKVLRDRFISSKCRQAFFRQKS